MKLLAAALLFVVFGHFDAWAARFVLQNILDAVQTPTNSVDDSFSRVILSGLRVVKKDHPESRLSKYFNEHYYNGLSKSEQLRLLQCVATGAVNQGADLGAYAMSHSDYDDFFPFFDPLIRDYHNIKTEVQHRNDWNVSDISGAPNNGKLDLKNLGLDNISIRVRVGRNLANFPLPGAMTRDQRVQLEKEMFKAFEKLIADPSYGGKYYSLTPDSKNQIAKSKYEELVKAHYMFKDMANDTHLMAAGIAADWPYGRGAYISADKGFIVWVGEEDHLRIMCMKKDGSVLNDVFDRLKTALDKVESVAGVFARSDRYGYVTSCPSNLGTGMRASVHLKLPKLTADGTDTKAKQIAKALGLSVRGLGGEHTPIGKDGTVDISPQGRLMITEGEILMKLYKGITAMLKAENPLPRHFGG